MKIYKTQKARYMCGNDREKYWITDNETGETMFFKTLNDMIEKLDELAPLELTPLI